MVFPEVAGKTVTGFYVFTRESAWYYDTIVDKERATIASLTSKTVYQMVAQPEGLETITISFMPGYGARETNRSGAAMLGITILPVVGAFVSRPERADLHYHNPGAAGDDELKAWIFKSMTGRKPASVDAVKVNRRLVKLATKAPKGKDALWKPIQQELKLRQEWAGSHNLDDRTFKGLSQVMQTTCKEN